MTEHLQHCFTFRAFDVSWRGFIWSFFITVYTVNVSISCLKYSYGHYLSSSYQSLEVVQLVTRDSDWSDGTISYNSHVVTEGDED